MSSLAAVSPKNDEVDLRAKPPDRELVRWQRRLLPFMIRFVVVMAFAFFVFSGLHIYQVTTFIKAEDSRNIRTQVESEIAKTANDKLTSDDVTQHALLLLEADALDKRYHQAEALLMSHIWSRQLSFITGMVMAFLGAVFILGKLSESPTQISGAAAEWKVAITSASPGIILSLLGTVLIVASLYVPATQSVTDGPAYANALPQTRQSNTGTPGTPDTAQRDDATHPISLEELKKLGPQKATAPPKK